MSILRAENCKDGVITFLEAITTGNGYNVTIQKVFNTPVSPAECDESCFAVVLMNNIDPMDHLPGGDTESIATIDIYAFYKNADDYVTKRKNLAADIEKKLTTDVSINNTCAYARLVRWELGEPDDSGTFGVHAELSAILFYDYQTPGV